MNLSELVSDDSVRRLFSMVTLESTSRPPEAVN